jgi:GntR family transcriptional regulator
VTRNDYVSPSRALANELLINIEEGRLKPGDQLPSERALAAAHGVARNTAREAVRLLIEQGLATAEHGRGVFVRPKHRLLRFGERRYSRTLREETGLSPYRAEVEAQGRTPRVNCTSITRITPPADIAERLNLSGPEDTVVRRENWYYADDDPVQVGITYSPWHIGEGTLLADSASMGPGSLYARWEEAGHAITTIREEISARMPSPTEAKDLAIPEGVPVIELMHTGFDQNGLAFEVTHFMMRADLNGLDYKITVEG